MAQQEMSEEQIKALQEKLKNMSPEELREFQKKQCIFCRIIEGNVQSKKIYEDEHVLAILDINPATPGHTLVMPKEHYSIMPQIPQDEISHIFRVVKVISNAALKSLEVQGCNVIVANGVAAGQRSQHFMAHLIFRKEKDGLDFQVPQKTIPEQELQKISDKISKNFGQKFEKRATPYQTPAVKEVIEAEFKDRSIKKASKKKQTKKDEPKKKPKGNDIDLDDIAKMLGAK